ncbi:MAG: hypothetical protein KDC93_07340 [Cyclobacteriaceae bacterium]|jgi:hypothetical protein|nr:hypothetical protein [Cyclobacteriaceae bacterium]
MRRFNWFLIVLFVGLPAVLIAQETVSSSAKGRFAKKQKSLFAEHIDFEGMVKRYLMKETQPMEPLEGIYSVSAIISKRGGFLANPNREKIIARKDNYAKVVIMKDSEHPNREYLEVSLASKVPGKYPVVGEFSSLSEGRAFVYKHYEPKQPNISYSFVLSEFDILDGVLTEVVRRKTITYKLSYLKIYPKKEETPLRRISNNK